MAKMESSSRAANEFSNLVQNSQYGIDKFCCGYELRRHRFEHNANEGSRCCREDWDRYIGPIERWGSWNPFDGHFAAVVLPTCKPERLSLASYIFEFAFLYDNVLESAAKASLDTNTESLVLDETQYRTVRSTAGTKQIQSKMLLELLSIDKPCADVVIGAWKEMVATTAHHEKTSLFENIEDYVDYRIIDTGAPFVDTVMRFGMGIILTKEEEELAAPITKSCFAALGLANDFYSFDIEWEAFQSGQEKSMTSAVWLYMNWKNLSVEDAKQEVRNVVRRYESTYQEEMNRFVSKDPRCSPTLASYLKSLAFQIPGNIVWSLRCPRYHPELTARAEAMLKAASDAENSEQDDQMTKRDSISSMHSLMQDSDSGSSVDSSSSRHSSVSQASSMSSPDLSPTLDLNGTKSKPVLGKEHLLAPYTYISSLPSKGFREGLIDALNIWLVLPDSKVKTIKSIAAKLHNSSLLLDDIEDNSPLRRGNPAAHTIFGQPQTINSANYLIIDAISESRQLEKPECTSLLLEELGNLFTGQSFDLHWTRQADCPEEDEYLEMVNQKTGGLFRLIGRLMTQCALSPHNKNIPINFLSELGQYFQIRDDYMNLVDQTYTDQKGFCEDLDEGKYSFPLVHCLRKNPSDQVLRGILRERQSAGSLSVPHKKMVLKSLQESGSMEYTLKKLAMIKSEIYNGLGAVERYTGLDNWPMRLLVHKLMV